MSNGNSVAIFVDAENLTQWIKRDGPETLLEELSSIGVVVVRKAYGRWSEASLSAHQGSLNRLGFELVHTFHPVSKKNSTDIQLTVDVMEYAGRDDLGSIVLATGDSDFSPLFRRLREMGKQVIGAAPRSALSESVKSSCSRFFYTDVSPEDDVQDEAVRASAFDDAADVLEAALKTFDGPANCSALKNRMLIIDSAFDEKALGCKSFSDFIRAVDGVNIFHDGKAWSASFEEAEPSVEITATPHDRGGGHDTEPTAQYRRILRKKGWRALPTAVMAKCFAALESIGDLPFSEIPETGSIACESLVTTMDVKKAAVLLRKAGVLQQQRVNEEGDTLWAVNPVSEELMLRAVDKAMTERLLSGVQSAGLKLDKKSICPLLLAKYSGGEVDKLIAEAKETCRFERPVSPEA